MFTTMVSSKNHWLLKVKILKLLIPILTILSGPVRLPEVEGFSLQKSLRRLAIPIRVTAAKSTTETLGKEQMTEPAQTEAPKEVTAEDTSK